MVCWLRRRGRVSHPLPNPAPYKGAGPDLARRIIASPNSLTVMGEGSESEWEGGPSSPVRGRMEEGVVQG